jgi:hypothetical protein
MKHPIFILGCPRSGTTVLASLLNNTGYGRPVETHFITKYFKKLESYGDISVKRNFSCLMKDILAERPVMQWKLGIDIEEFYSELDNFSFGHIVDQICMKMAGKKGNEVWGDKTPRYILDLDIIYKLFPDSKYFYIIRDGRDVALSLLEREWGPENILDCAELWKAHNAERAALDEIDGKGHLYVIRYEDLLDNAENIVPEIYEFLDVEYDKGEVSRLAGTVKKGNYNKWKKRMSPGQVRIFENVSADTLKRFGYETSYEERPITGFIKCFYTLHRMLFRAKYLFKINVIDGIKIKYFDKEPFAD